MQGDGLSLILDGVADIFLGEPHDPQPEEREREKEVRVEDLHYDSMVVIKGDYLLLSCCILALPSLLLG